MINFTPIVRPYFRRLASRYDRWLGAIGTTQLGQLKRLIDKGAGTRYGAEYGLEDLKAPDGEDLYKAFRNRVPLVSYEELAPWIMRMVEGERDVLWPGRCDRFAQSSGTSDGRSKYIPLTPASLKINHYAGATDVVAHYLKLYPSSRIFSGKGFILGGSFANNIQGLRPEARVGDLSASLIASISPLANLVRVPSKKLALLEDWTVKLPSLAQAAVKQNVTNISGVPSWFLAVLKESLRITGASNIHEIWPNLEVFFHGGIAFGPYRQEYDRITDTSKMRYLETYNASEGFFGVQTAVDDPGLQLILDTGVFYEFLPLDADPNDGEAALASWQVEPGKTYALILSSCNGLWRYSIGDTVTVTSADPLKILIAGRTKNFINAFGEELMVHNAERAVADVCAAHDCSISNFTAGPLYPSEGRKGRHQWIVEWSRKPKDIEKFADDLDRRLTELNSDYGAKRAGNLFLDRLEIITAPEGTFNRWLASTGKLGGQRKVPRLYNSRRYLDPILQMIDKP